MAKRLRTLAGEFGGAGAAIGNTFQFAPQVSALPDGGYVVLWREADGLHLQRFNKFGATALTDIVVAETDTTHRLYDVAGLSNGGFAVSWVAADGEGSPQLMVQLYGPDRSPAGAAVLAASSGVAADQAPAMAGLSGGGFVIIAPAGAGLVARIFDASGGLAGALALPAAGGAANPAVAGLPTGGFAVAWEQGAGESREVRLQRFDAHGAPTTAETAVAAGYAGDGRPQIAVLSSGALAIVWQESAADGVRVLARIVDPAGNAGEAMQVALVPAGHHAAPTVAALAAGGFMVAWSDTHDRLDTAGSSIQSQMFDSGGAAAGPQTRLNDYLPGDQSLPMLAGLTDGSVAALWQGTNSIDAVYRGVRGKIVASAEVVENIGTADADTLSESAAPGTLWGLEGNDSLTGGASDDLLSGGDGDDILLGKGANDRLEGGAGADLLDGGVGNDDLVGGEGDDTLRYGDGLNNYGFDRLDGGAGNDLFEISAAQYAGNAVEAFGGDGDDRFLIRWNTHAGTYGGIAVRVDAGPGRDRIEVRDARSRIEITLGEGSDTFVPRSLVGLFGDSAAAATITDFAAGPAGDLIELQVFNQGPTDAFLGWDGSENPFAAGFLAVEQRGADTVVLIRSNRSLPFQEMVILRNLDASTLTAENFGGLPPDGSVIPGRHIVGTSGNEHLQGFLGHDRIEGLAGFNSIAGMGGNDVLIGGGDQDILSGGLGDDELEGGEGFDTLYGDEGSDILRGGGGFDDLRGWTGNDVLDGGPGDDWLAGGEGDDVYIVGDADRVTELAEQGIDEVRTALGSRSDYSALYVLPVHVENLTGTSASGQGVRGNAHANVIVMGAGGDLVVLDGGGNDTVSGGGGDDFLYWGGTFTNADKADGGAGFDTVGLLGAAPAAFDADDLLSIEKLAVYSSGNSAAPNSYSLVMHNGNVAAGQQMMVVAQSLLSNEVLTFNGAAELDGSFNVRGGRGADLITGGAGGDKIWGGLGADQLEGGLGNDLFEYSAAAESTAAAADVIMDFARGDRIYLSGIDADGNASNGDSKFSWLGTGAFTGQAGQLRVAQDPQHSRTWVVEADIDGDQVADLTIYLVGPADFIPHKNDFYL